MKNALLRAIGLAVVALGCSSSAPQDELPAPVITLSEDDHGREIPLNRGDAFLIKLKGDGDKDSFWGVRKVPDTVEFLFEQKGDADHNFEFLFRLKDSGPVELVFAKFHEDRAEKTKDYKVTMKVR
jgi:hypothetical protein